jgi:hypothetical protein
MFSSSIRISLRVAVAGRRDRSPRGVHGQDLSEAGTGVLGGTSRLAMQSLRALRGRATDRRVGDPVRSLLPDAGAPTTQHPLLRLVRPADVCNTRSRNGSRTSIEACIKSMSTLKKTSFSLSRTIAKLQENTVWLLLLSYQTKAPLSLHLLWRSAA